eukprot:403354820
MTITQTLVQEILTYWLDPSVSIRSACIDPGSYYLSLGDDQPSVSCYDFKDMVCKLSGHLSNCTALTTERSQNPRILISGAIDTNVKLWDIRMKTCINTFKSHNEQITCVDISPDSLTVVSGSMDGNVKLWDLRTSKLLKNISVSNQGGYPQCLSFNPIDTCLAVGTSDKIIKYWELQDFSIISQTNIENYVAQKLIFDKEGIHTFVGFYDCIKVYNLNDPKPKLLDMLPKGGYRDILDIKINTEQGYLFTVEQPDSQLNTVVLSNIAVSDINFNPNIKPNTHVPMPSSISVDQKPIHTQLRKGQSFEPQQQQNISGSGFNQKPSLLAKNGQNMMGISQSSGFNVNQDFLDKQQRPPSSTSQKLKTFYQQPKFDQPTDLKLEDFLNDQQPGINIDSELKVLQESVKDHNKMLYILKQRNEILANMLKYWQKGDLNSVIQSFQVIKDPNIVVDALACTLANADANSSSNAIDQFNFVQALQILQKLEDVFNTDKFEFHLTIALKTLKNILRVFSERILSIIKPLLLMGEDISKLNSEQQDRKRKCDQIIEKIEVISKSKGLKKLVQLSKSNSNLMAKNVQMDIENLIRNCRNIPSNSNNLGNNEYSLKNNFF